MEKGYDTLILPAIVEKDEKIPIGGGRFHHRRAGDLLNPTRENEAVLADIRRQMGPGTFAVQYQLLMAAEQRDDGSLLPLPEAEGGSAAARRKNSNLPSPRRACCGDRKRSASSLTDRERLTSQSANSTLHSSPRQVRRRRGRRSWPLPS